MVISSLIIETTEETVHTVANKLMGIEGVEVHHVEDYKIIITVESVTLDESHGITKDFVNIEGIVTINLAYCNFENDPTLHFESNLQV